VNTREVLGIAIHESVYSFFINNKEFCFLTNKNEELYEIPVAVYINVNKNKLQFIGTFGTSIKNKNAILGSYYYFTNYDNAVVNSQIELDETDVIKCIHKAEHGIIRFALFLGKTKIIDNNEKNGLDNSIIKKERLMDNNLDNNIEKLTLRISDHDGHWSQEYDSCFLGNIELDNGTVLKNIPLYVVKEYNQQIPLSYHHLLHYNNINIIK
jgi:hypothetical protein